MEFNVNHCVMVRLTDHGRNILRRNHVDLYRAIGKENPNEYVPKAEDADGWSKWQLWELMQELGPRCTMGSPVPFETTIRILDGD